MISFSLWGEVRYFFLSFFFSSPGQKIFNLSGRGNKKKWMKLRKTWRKKERKDEGRKEERRKDEGRKEEGRKAEGRMERKKGRKRKRKGKNKSPFFLFHFFSQFVTCERKKPYFLVYFVSFPCCFQIKGRKELTGRLKEVEYS